MQKSQCYRFIPSKTTGADRTHDEKLKAEHLTNVNGQTVQIWSCVSTKMTFLFGILQYQMRIGKQYTYILGAYITQEPHKFQSSHSTFSSTGYLKRASYNVINFQAVVKRKCLVRFSYSSAAEFSTVITDRLREQSESPSAAAKFQYNTNYCAL